MLAKPAFFTLNNTSQTILPKLIALKALTLVAATMVAALAYYFFDVQMSSPFFKLSLLLGYGILVVWVLRLYLTFPVSELEVTALLLSDGLILFFLIDATGGGQNPFTSSLLIPLAIAVALVKKRYSVFLLLAVIAMYAYWIFTGSFSGMHGAHSAQNAFSLHLYGMWINFLICAILLFVFIAYAMDSMRDREKQLQQAREKILNDEKLVAVATLTASTSHALGSPLSTMAILLEDAEQQGQLELKNVQLMQQQLTVCKQHLNHIAATARSLDTSIREKISVATLVENLTEHFNITRPAQVLDFEFDRAKQDVEIAGDVVLLYNQSLFMALVNLIDNALQAAVNATKVRLHAIDKALVINIIDDGPGLTGEVQDKLGQKFISTKAEGWGLGVYLANSTIEKFDGKILMENYSQGGTLTQITLPLFPTC